MNLDLPRDPATYLHRVGRTGRFGGKGLAVTLLSRNEVQGVQLLARVFKMEISELPSPIPAEIYAYATAAEEEGSGGDEDPSESVGAEEKSDEEIEVCGEEVENTTTPMGKRLLEVRTCRQVRFQADT